MFFKKGNLIQLLVYTFLTSAGMLSKIPVVLYLFIFIPYLFGNYSIRKKLAFVAVSLIPVILTFLWYFFWNPYLATQFGNFNNFGYSLSIGFADLLKNWQKVSIRFIYHAFYSVILFSIFLFGIFHLIKYKNRILLLASLLFLPPFFLFMCKAGYLFYQHNYYIIPFVPFMALVAAYGLSQIKKKWLFSLILILGISESIFNQFNDFFIDDKEKYKLKLSIIAQHISTENDLVSINGNGNPQLIYFTNRKGWTAFDSELKDTNFLKKITRDSCRYIIIDQRTMTDSLNHQIVYRDDDFVVYMIR